MASASPLKSADVMRRDCELMNQSRRTSTVRNTFDCKNGYSIRNPKRGIVLISAASWPALLVGALALAQDAASKQVPPAEAPAEASTPKVESPPSNPQAPPAATAPEAGSAATTPTPKTAAAPQTPPVPLQPEKVIPFEYSPYKILVWVAASSSAELDASLLAQLHESIKRNADVTVGAPWSVTVSAPPQSLYHTIALCPHLLTDVAIAAADKNLLKADKIILVSLSATQQSWRVWTRELDCHARIWGPQVRSEFRQPAALANTVFDAISAAFAPLARIEDGQGKTCIVRARAGGLVTSSDSPIAIGNGDILQPIFRQNDRYGDPQPGRIEILPFTFLQVTTTDPLSPTLWNCNVHSGMRSPIHGRSPPTSRRERWAVKVRPRYASTTLLIESKRVKPADIKIPLAGIEVYSKSPQPEAPREMSEEEKKEAEKKNPPELLGITDWRGSMQLEHNGPLLRVAYLKNGGLLLARLPIVPGLDERIVAEIPDDSPRLQAEGFVRGMSSEVTDLVVQRQLIALRMRKNIDNGKLDDAGKLLEDFRTLKTLNDLQQAINLQLPRQKQTNSVAVKQRVEKLYSDERELLAKYVDAELQGKLSAELATARANPQPPATEQKNFLEEESPKKKVLPSALQPKGTDAAATSTSSSPAAAPPATSPAPMPSGSPAPSS